ncbi:hypothetical protein M441DRAFT_449319, partial [Trichoderma asperellum CBS 433.97]
MVPADFIFSTCGAGTLCYYFGASNLSGWLLCFFFFPSLFSGAPIFFRKRGIQHTRLVFGISGLPLFFFGRDSAV